jgi:hypothetical protein
MTKTITAATVGTITALRASLKLVGLYGQVELTPVTQQFCLFKELKFTQTGDVSDTSLRDNTEKR